MKCVATKGLGNGLADWKVSVTSQAGPPLLRLRAEGRTADKEENGAV